VAVAAADRGSERFGVKVIRPQEFSQVFRRKIMSALSLRLPHSLHERARTLARREGISINQLISTALAEKMAALLTEEYFRERGQRASRAKFLAALAKVPDVEPEDHDKLESPTGSKRRRATRGQRAARKKQRSRISNRNGR
jgi:hypothetical protein